MDDNEKRAAAIRDEYGKKGLDCILENRRNAIMQRDADAIAYWEAIAKAYQRLP